MVFVLFLYLSYFFNSPIVFCTLFVHFGIPKHFILESQEVAVLPVDPCAEKSLKIIRMMEPMTTSDIANANTSSASLVSKPHDLDDVDSDDIVYRKPKTTIGKQQKRVSFHECTLEVPPDNQHFDEQSTSKEIERLSNSLKSSASNLSRAVGDLSAFKYEQEGVEIGKDSILLGNDGIQEISAKRMFEVPSSLRPSSKSLNPICSVKSFLLGPPNLDNGDNVPVTERGIPEGQEDPPHNCPNYIDKKSSSIPDCFSVSVCDQSRILNSCSSGTLGVLLCCECNIVITVIGILLITLIPGFPCYSVIVRIYLFYFQFQAAQVLNLKLVLQEEFLVVLVVLTHLQQGCQALASAMC